MPRQTISHVGPVLKTLTEHRIFWTSRSQRPLPRRLVRLKRFFVSYARRNFRNFPWRAPKTSAFGLLLAELLLAQTKAEDVARIWPRLVSTYPTPKHLSQARLSSLRGLVKSLGLQNQRAKALHNVG